MSKLGLLIGSVVALMTAGCATKTPQEKQEAEVKRHEQPVVVIPPNTRLAEALLEAKNGSSVEGTVSFEQLPNNMLVTYDIKGLPPSQEFGFHIHEMGDCSSDDGKSAGGHYFPLSDRGGTSSDYPGRYAGDFPMIRSDKEGLAEGNYKTSKLTVAKNRAIVGRAVMIHGGPDDITKPSAPRIACGVIVVKTPMSTPDPDEAEEGSETLR